MAALDPIIFIPGFPASELYSLRSGRRIFPLMRNALGMDDSQVPDFQARSDQPDHVIATRPIRAMANLLGIELLDAAGSLYEQLADHGYQEYSPFFQPFGWDWRLPVSHSRTLAALHSLIEQVMAGSPGRKIIFVVHSTGGLVLREFFLDPANASIKKHIRTVIAFGVPWAGLLETVRKILGQERFGNISQRHVGVVIGHAGAAYDLLPLQLLGHHSGLSGRSTPPDMIDGASPTLLDEHCPRDPASGRPMAAMARQRIQATVDQVQWTDGLSIINVAGWGESTRVALKVTSGNEQTPQFRQSHTILGDGTVPYVSARWLAGAEVTHLPACLVEGLVHRNIWQTDTGGAAIDAAISGKPVAVTVTIGCRMADGGRSPRDLALTIHAGLSGLDTSLTTAHELILENRSPGIPDYRERIHFDAEGMAILELKRGYFKQLPRNLSTLNLLINVLDGDGKSIEARRILVTWRSPRHKPSIATRRED